MWPFRAKERECGPRCYYKLHYDKFNEAYKVVSAQNDELRKENARLLG